MVAAGRRKKNQGPKYNREAESYCIGGVLRETTESDRLRRFAEADHLDPADFYDPDYQAIFRAMRKLRTDGLPFTERAIVSEALAMDSTADSKRLTELLDQLKAEDFTTCKIPYYAKRVKECSNDRRTRQAIAEFQRDLNDDAAPAIELINNYTERLREIGLSAASTNWPKATGADDLSGEEELEWVWMSFLALGYITLLSSVWKAGKSTLLACLLAELANGGILFDRPVCPARAIVLTEEPSRAWRRRRLRFGFSSKSAHFISLCDFRCPPNPENWPSLLTHVEKEAERLSAKVIVIDVLQAFWGVLDENDPAKVLAAMAPLKALAAKGYAILLIGHTAKAEAGKGKAARGTGALPGSVDCIMEWRRVDSDDINNSQRELTVIGRLEDDPIELIIDYDRGIQSYTVLGESSDVAKQASEDFILTLLPSQRSSAMTVTDVIEAWEKAKAEGKWKGKVPSKRKLGDVLPNGTLGDSPKWSSIGAGTPRDPRKFFLDA